VLHSITQESDFYCSIS